VLELGAAHLRQRSQTMGESTIRDNGIQTDKEIQNPVSEPKITAHTQILLHSETDISRIDEYQKFGRKRMQDYNLISSSLATSQHF